MMLDSVFHPKSIALAGITITNPEHWTRNYLTALIDSGFPGEFHLVNPKGGDIDGHKVYRNLAEIPGPVDYVISTVSASAAPELIKNCFAKGVKTVQLCTSGFSETGEEEGIALEAEVVRLARETGIRIIGPNCLGPYCPESRISWETGFPMESGPVGLISQSGGNAAIFIKHHTVWRGVRFSKVISYGNACDLDESDFLQYLTEDPATSIIAMYIEGVKDGDKFKRALEKASRAKTVVLLKGGVTSGGARASMGHTGALAGDATAWDALCKQYGIIQTGSLEEMADVIVTLLFFSRPQGRNAVVLGAAGGASVTITDQLEKYGIVVPPISPEIKARIRSIIPIAGNSLRNPLDIGQSILQNAKIIETANIASRWSGCDFLTMFIHAGSYPPTRLQQLFDMIDGIYEKSQKNSKPLAFVVLSSAVPDVAELAYTESVRISSFGIPVYANFEGAARAIGLVLRHYNL